MVNRPQFLLTSALVSGQLITNNSILKSKANQSSTPEIITSDKIRPSSLRSCFASGDISGLGKVVIWSRSDRPTRMIVEYAIS
ncbi:hypothetical protein [Okeania sp.]|uniref:hypothetical protein n=1 Tax=Okeania sp. TaxID=3100323 RepID=UPI002B4B58F4|nr:hypothetical protein [Okeania sp.]MEB3339703.1 hypothetical protein [Okeania sp.]